MITHNDTWTLVPPPEGKDTIGNKWISVPKGTWMDLSIVSKLVWYRRATTNKMAWIFKKLSVYNKVGDNSSCSRHFNHKLLVNKQLYVSNNYFQYLYGGVQEVYMKQTNRGSQIRVFPKHVFHLHKSHCLKQAPHAWFHKLPH